MLYWNNFRVVCLLHGTKVLHGYQAGDYRTLEVIPIYIPNISKFVCLFVYCVTRIVKFGTLSHIFKIAHVCEIVLQTNVVDWLCD